MFNFTKETVINSLLLDDKVTQRIQSDGEMFRVLRCADYMKANVVDKVFKTSGNTGVVATATFTAPSTAGIYRIDLNIKLSTKYLSDYAAAVYKFQKPLFAEFELTTNAATNAERIVKGLQLAIPENNKFLRIEKSGNNVVVTCTDSDQYFETAQLLKYTQNASLPSEGEYTLVSEAVKTANTPEFATGDWLIENLRFPSYPNVRYNSLNSEETPLAGQLYTMYAFTYSVKRQGLTGLGTVGQALESTTTHVFYVLNSLVMEFESKMVEAFGPDAIKVIVAGTAYTVSVLTSEADNKTVPNDGTDVQISSTISPGTATGWTYTLVTPVAGVAINSSGIMTVQNTVPAGTELTVLAKETSTKAEGFGFLKVV